MKVKKARKQKQPRDMVTLGMILTCKGGPMRDRRERRPKDARRDETRSEQW